MFYCQTILVKFSDFTAKIKQKNTKKKIVNLYRVIEAKSDERIKFEDIKAFVLQYWLLTASCLVVYGTVLPWNNIGGSFIKTKYGYGKKKKKLKKRK